MRNTGTNTKKALCTELWNKSDFRSLSRVPRFFSVNGVSLVREIENPVWKKKPKTNRAKDRGCVHLPVASNFSTKSDRYFQTKYSFSQQKHSLQSFLSTSGLN